MMKDKYSAVWVSHSSISDYLKCPRSYFLKNVYRDPKTHHKVMLIQPALALGQAVHEVVESLSVLPVEVRFEKSLLSQFEIVWKKVSGRSGGFKTEEEEEKMKERGVAMLKRVTEHPGPFLLKAIKIRQDLPNFWLSEEDEIVLCGKIDWLVYDEEHDSVKILDFKTGKSDEDSDSLQLPIYNLLVTNCQTKKVSGAAYWYLDRDTEPVDVTLPDITTSRARVLEIAKRIALARKVERFLCPRKDGCHACRPLEAVIRGEATLVGVNGFKQDVYVL